MQIWLIEVNVNPCLATNCEALKEAVPEVVRESIREYGLSTKLKYKVLIEYKDTFRLYSYQQFSHRHFHLDSYQRHETTSDMFNTMYSIPISVITALHIPNLK